MVPLNTYTFFFLFFFNVKIKIVLKDYDKSNKQAKTLSFLIQNVEKCIAIMEDLEALPVNLIILKKNPDIMNTIKKVCISIGV